MSYDGRVRAHRLALLGALVAFSVFAACAPLLSYDDLSDVPRLEGGAGDGKVAPATPDGPAGGDALAAADGGVDGAIVDDAGDPCVTADAGAGVNSWWCEPALTGMLTNRNRLWHCRDHQRVEFTDCAGGCFKADDGFPDLCAKCNLGAGNGDYCPADFAADYYGPGQVASYLNKYVIHCAAGNALPASTHCDGGCVGPGPTAHCP